MPIKKVASRKASPPRQLPSGETKKNLPAIEQPLSLPPHNRSTLKIMLVLLVTLLVIVGLFLLFMS